MKKEKQEEAKLIRKEMLKARIENRPVDYNVLVAKVKSLNGKGHFAFNLKGANVRI